MGNYVSSGISLTGLAKFCSVVLFQVLALQPQLQSIISKFVLLCQYTFT